MENPNYIPERLFVYNLFFCSGYTCEELHEEINDRVGKQIDKEIECTENSIKKHSKDREISILSDSFIKSVKEMEKTTTLDEHVARQKVPDYCLIKYYNIIRSLNKYIESENGRTRHIHNKLKTDIDILHEFSDSIAKLRFDCGAGAVSQKGLKRILDPIGKPYTPAQHGFIEFMISHVFPRTNKLDSSFYSSVKQKTWEDVICSELCTSRNLIYFHGDTSTIEEAKSFFHDTFQKLLNMDENECDNIGLLLLAMYHELVRLFKSNILSDIAAQNIPQHAVPSSESDATMDYDAILSTHILNFMRWLPIISDEPYDSELFRAVNNVIEKIRDQLLICSSAEVSHESLLINKRENIFISKNNVNLRKLLIGHLHNEFFVHTQFHEFYKLSLAEQGD